MGEEEGSEEVAGPSEIAIPQLGHNDGVASLTLLRFAAQEGLQMARRADIGGREDDRFHTFAVKPVQCLPGRLLGNNLDARQEFGFELIRRGYLSQWQQFVPVDANEGLGYIEVAIVAKNWVTD